MIIWKDINFLQDVYDGYQMSNDKEIRRITNEGHYYSIPTFKKGKKYYFNIKSTDKLLGIETQIPLNVDKIYDYLFPMLRVKGEVKVTDELIEKMKEDYRNNYRAVDISRKYQVPISRVQLILKTNED